jgi:hypothetical protein
MPAFYRIEKHERHGSAGSQPPAYATRGHREFFRAAVRSLACLTACTSRGRQFFLDTSDSTLGIKSPHSCFFFNKVSLSNNCHSLASPSDSDGLK